MPRNESAVVWICGEHDASTVGEVARLFAEALASTDGDIVVDLSGTQFLGIAPLQLMLKVGEFLASTGRSLEFRAPSRPARVVLDLCGVPWVAAATLPDHSVITGASRALESWVAVPARVRLVRDPHIPAPGVSPQSAPIAQPIRIGEP